MQKYVIRLVVLLSFALLPATIAFGPPLTDEELEQAKSRINWSTKTLGFEAESRDRGDGSTMVSQMKERLTSGTAPEVVGFEGPYLNRDWGVEDTGNVEFRSKVMQRSNVIVAMKQFVQEMTPGGGGHESAVRGFHLHVRFPISELQIPEAEFLTWLARVGDSIAGVRAVDYKGSFATNISTQIRQAPDGAKINNRGTIRVKKIGNEWDIEFRGFIRSLRSLERHLDAVFAGLANPELIRPMGHWHHAVFNQTLDLGRMVDQWARMNNKTLLSQEQISQLTQMAGQLTKKDSMVYPVMNFELLPWLNSDERRKIRDANNEFLEKMYTRMQKKGIAGAKSSFYLSIQRWGKASRIDLAMERGVLLSPGSWGPEAVTSTLVQKLANFPDATWARQILAELPVDSIAERAAEVVTTTEAANLARMLPSEQAQEFVRRFANRTGDVCAAILRSP